jgi:hypothetical protein
LLNALFSLLQHDCCMSGSTHFGRSAAADAGEHGRPVGETEGEDQMARLEIPRTGEAEITPNVATADILLELGMMYCSGREVERNYVTAHKWLNLAALKGSEAARLYRLELAREMSVAEIAEAQRQARAWMTMH